MHVLVVAGLPGFGFPDAPSHAEFPHTFGKLAGATDRLCDAVALRRYVLYLFDSAHPSASDSPSLDPIASPSSSRRATGVGLGERGKNRMRCAGRPRG